MCLVCRLSLSASLNNRLFTLMDKYTFAAPLVLCYVLRRTLVLHHPRVDQYRPRPCIGDIANESYVIV
jgi:hypothetical protein